MRIIEIEAIEIIERQRRSFNQEQIKELSISIETKGLFHPVVCVQANGNLRLVAGERRLRAVTMLSNREAPYRCDEEIIAPHSIPYILLGEDLTSIELREAELEENTIRADLTWQEKVQAQDELHALRLAQDPKQTIVKTARELQRLEPDKPIQRIEKAISKSRIIAQHMDDPEIARAKDADQAFRLTIAKMDKELRAELARRGATTETKHTLILGDAIEHMVNMKPEFDVILADPPYGMGADKFGDADQSSHTYEDDEEAALIMATAIFDVGFHITKHDAHLYMFCDIEHFFQIRQLASDYGWLPFRTPLVWNKETSLGHAPLQNRGPRRNYELFLFASKGDKPFSKIYGDVISTPAVRGKEVAAQKPPELYRTLLSRSCLPGDKVLDPCCGSGTIFLAADALNLEATGIEINPGSHTVATVTLASLGETDDIDE